MNGNVVSTGFTGSYSANRRSGMTPEEFKRYFEARRRINSKNNMPGNENQRTAPGKSRVNTPTAPARRGAAERSTAARPSSNQPSAIAKKLEVIVRNSDIVGVTKRAAEEWLEIDRRECRAEGEKKKIPFSTMLVILTVSVALLLIVAGTVITSRASTELYSAKARLEQSLSEKDELERKLEIKNDLKYIEMVARAKLGMVDREYAAVKYIGTDAGEKVVIYEGGGNRGIKVGLSTLLSALGFPD